MIRFLPAAMGTALLLSACGHRAGVASAPPPASSPPPTPASGEAPGATSAGVIAATPALATLARAFAASGVGATLDGGGPYTVFAPTDAAFARLAPGTVDTLLKPENRTPLTRLLTYHVVRGAITSADLAARILAGGGKATLATVEGDPLVATLSGVVITLTDVNGNRSYIETADRRSADGVVHVVNGVLVPNLG